MDNFLEGKWDVMMQLLYLNYNNIIKICKVEIMIR